MFMFTYLLILCNAGFSTTFDVLEEKRRQKHGYFNPAELHLTLFIYLSRKRYLCRADSALSSRDEKMAHRGWWPIMRIDEHQCDWVVFHSNEFSLWNIMSVFQGSYFKCCGSYVFIFGRFLQPYGFHCTRRRQRREGKRDMELLIQRRRGLWSVSFNIQQIHTNSCDISSWWVSLFASSPMQVCNIFYTSRRLGRK